VLTSAAYAQVNARQLRGAFLRALQCFGLAQLRLGSRQRGAGLQRLGNQRIQWG